MEESNRSGDLDLLRVFRQLGVRIIGLTAVPATTLPPVAYFPQPAGSRRQEGLSGGRALVAPV